MMVVRTGPWVDGDQRPVLQVGRSHDPARDGFKQSDRFDPGRGQWFAGAGADGGVYDARAAADVPAGASNSGLSTVPKRVPQTAEPGQDSMWYVYLIECADGRLYAGITVDLAARFARHASGKGAAFMRMSKPVRYVAASACASRGEAARAEAALKKLKRTDKLAWAAANPPVSAKV